MSRFRAALWRAFDIAAWLACFGLLGWAVMNALSVFP